MLEFLFKKKSDSKRVEAVNLMYQTLKSLYNTDNITQERKDYLSDLMGKYGYIPYSYNRANNELSNEEVLFVLEQKWTQNNVLKDGVFEFTNSSVLARNKVTNSNWIQKEGHDIKLINLAGLGDNSAEKTGTMMNWLRQIAILPTGNVEAGIFNTTVYLIPFHPREFGCAYLPSSSEASSVLADEKLQEMTEADATEQVRIFINFAQLAGHPVIYDILPQTGRFSKAVLANPYIARWYDINGLVDELDKYVDKVAAELSKELNADDINLVKEMYKQSMRTGSATLTDYYKEIYDRLDKEMLESKKYLSSAMLEKSIQDKLHKKVKGIIAQVVGTSKKLEEHDITNQGLITQALIHEGMWPAPGGAWCSCGVPVFDRMSECASYPMFKHFDYKGQDVTEYANLDCQTPYYFVQLENGKENHEVVVYFINYMKKLQEYFNFDGFRVDHIDHIVDEVSEKDGVPISYRAPRHVLGKLNSEMKENVLYFATLAEYMLWDNYYKEYHKDMGFDLLWGNDIVSQSFKNPEEIVEDNTRLSNYNTELDSNKTPLSILKTYNNQDGEFEAIDRYPAQLGREGALFKWFKYKFLPGGKNAQRSMLYVDGDESFTQKGIEAVIGSEIAMTRNDDEDFFKVFDAIDRFVKYNPVINSGEAHIIKQDEDGFVAWQISKTEAKDALLVVANYMSPTEKFVIEENGNSYTELREGKEVFDKNIVLPCDYQIVSEYKFNGEEFSEEGLQVPMSELTIGKLMPAEFKIYKLDRV
ncbi:TPA: hypothetical protein CPT80_02315 [Candidatus Gastranaerophilales bacterium HUM_9]|nr:MAG TPA: hypothetical protein CPT80_02315 [Candidatus Gastranaerophilales bacterium HUM_9]HBX34695.1 hypothetical protein [Cyanobacteria bacterium UBA11440]